MLLFRTVSFPVVSFFINELTGNHFPGHTPGYIIGYLVSTVRCFPLGILSEMPYPAKVEYHLRSNTALTDQKKSENIIEDGHSHESGAFCVKADARYLEKLR